MKLPELLAPAGDFEKLQTAFRYGADACYMGIKSMSMRVKIDDQGGDMLEEAFKLKNKLGKKVYLTMNIHAHENKLNFLDKELKRLAELHEKGLDPDGILVSDVGIFHLLKQKAPWLPLHISTQANTLNSAAIMFWASQGVERVVFGREVSLREIQKIKAELKKNKVKVELEAFVHGAMCMAYSGRCLLSNFMAYRDANEGMCAHSCRWKYRVHKTENNETEGEDYNPRLQKAVLEEEMRPGQYIPIEEDENGTSLMSAKDMCMIEHLDDVLATGIESLKIEGRHKTPYYLAIVCRAYRQAMDLAAKGKKPTKEILEDIESINTRGFFTGFWYGKPGAEGQNYEDRASYNDHYCFAGIVRKVEGKEITMEVRNRLDKGDKLQIITPKKTITFALKEFKNAKNGEVIDHASAGQGFSIIFETKEKVEVGDIVRKVSK